MLSGVAGPPWHDCHPCASWHNALYQPLPPGGRGMGPPGRPQARWRARRPAPPLGERLRPHVAR